MPRLDSTPNHPVAWQTMMQNARRRIEVDLNEVERVIELARRTPGLGDYQHELQELSISFQVATRLIGNGHTSLTDEIDERFHALCPPAQQITWRLGDTIEIAWVPVEDMARSAEIGAEVLVSHEFSALGNKSDREPGDFTATAQAIVDAMVDPLLVGEPTFAQIQDATPQHALAATMIVFETSRVKAPVINQTFQHFV